MCLLNPFPTKESENYSSYEFVKSKMLEESELPACCIKMLTIQKQ